MRYNKNLHIEGNKVISYTTHVATIDRAAGKLRRHGYWSQTTSKHINHVASELGLEVVDDKSTDTQEKSQDEGSSMLKTVALVASFAEIMGGNQKEKNDWKARMLKAGLGNSGLIMPDDWDTLDEATKEARLNSAIGALT